MLRLPHIETGTYVSGAGHLGFLAWLVLGGLFYSAPDLPVPTTDVTILSEAEFAALTRAPDVAQPDEVAEAPEQPAAVIPDPAPAPSRPEAVETPPAPPPAPIQTPEIETAPTPAPAPPPPAPRVAPEPVPQPEPETEIAPERQEATTPDVGGEVTAPAQSETAPEAATTRIITEATETDPDSQAPDLTPELTASPRPPSRPSRPRPAPAEEIADPLPEPPAPQTDPVADAVAAAVAEATVAPPAPQTPTGTAASRPDVPVGPPLTSGEREGLRLAVQACWNVGSLSTEALRTTVVVAVEMEQSGRPVTGSIRMISSEGGSGAAASQAFEAARRAIIRCGSAGFDLPVEKYAQWRDIEMTFNPERMRIR